MPLMKPAFEARSHLKNEPTKEQLLATKYKLDQNDGNLPVELRKWSHKKQSRISGGIPVNNDDVDDQSMALSEGEILWQRQETAVRNIFTDPRISTNEREVIAKALLEGNFSIDNNSYSKDTHGDMHQEGKSDVEYITHADGTRHLLKKVYEKDLIRGEANVHRARMRKPNFLEAQGVQAPIILVDPRMVQYYEQQKTKMQLQSPSKGKKGVYTWAGQTLTEKAIPDTISSSKEYFDQIKNEHFMREKKKMLISAKHRELLRAKAMIATTKKLNDHSKQQEKDRKANIGLKREYINNFRTKLKQHLVKTENPMMGTIMKYVNDKIAWSILQSYKGYTMSMAAVVGLIGQTLGTLEPVETNSERESRGGEVEDAFAAQWQNMMEHERTYSAYGESNTPHQMGHTYLTEVEPSAPNTANSEILVDLENTMGMSMGNIEGTEGDVVGGDSIRFKDDSESAHNSLLLGSENMNNDNESRQQTLNDSIATSHRELEVLQQTTVTVGEVKRLHEKNAFIKPLSAKGLPVKSIARENVFAPRGIHKADLPYSTDRVNYKLGSRGRSRGDSKGHTTSGGNNQVRWNSDDVNPLHPSDRLVIDGTSGTIINVNAWHSNPGSRANTPSALGIKGWNANIPILKKFAAGYTSEVDESGALVRPGTGTRSRPQTSDNYQENGDNDRDAYREYVPVQGERIESPNKLHQVGSEGSQFAQSQTETKILHASISQLSMPQETMTHLTHSVNLDSHNASINDSAMDPEEWDFVKPLVSAIEHEKIALGTIARHQPEIVLTDLQLEELGKGKTTIDTIAAHARWAKEKKLRMSQKMQNTEAQMINQAVGRSSVSELMDKGKKSPHAVGTHHNAEEGMEMKGSPLMTTTATATNTGTGEEGDQPTEGRLQTSQTLGDLNAMTSMNDPPGGIEIKINQFSNMDVELGFRPEPKPGSHEDIGIKPLTPLDVKSPLLSTQTDTVIPGGATQSPQLSPTLQAVKSQGNMSIGTGPLKDTGSLDKSMYSLEDSKEISRLINNNVKAPPHQLKSLAKPLPESPFKSYEEKTRVIQSGVAASAGLSLWLSKTEREARLQRWGPRAKSREGRFRVGKSSDPSASFSPTKDQVAQRKKKSRALLP